MLANKESDVSDLKISHKDYVQGKNVDQLRQLIATATVSLEELEKVEKVKLLAVYNGSYFDSYFYEDDIDGAIAALQKIVASDKYRSDYKFDYLGIREQWFYPYEVDALIADGDLAEKVEVNHAN